jgi:hypothetical protein
MVLPFAPRQHDQVGPTEIRRTPHDVDVDLTAYCPTSIFG